MTAQEMFEKMGYQRKENDVYISYVINYETDFESIEFCKATKELLHAGIDVFSINELKTINQQMIELGWI